MSLKIFNTTLVFSVQTGVDESFHSGKKQQDKNKCPQVAPEHVYIGD